MLIGISIAASALTSAIVTKILAAHYFKIVDSYVEDMCDLALKSNERALKALDKLETVIDLKVDGEALCRAVQKGLRRAEVRYSTGKGGEGR